MSENTINSNNNEKNDMKRVYIYLAFVFVILPLGQDSVGLDPFVGGKIIRFGIGIKDIFADMTFPDPFFGAVFAQEIVLDDMGIGIVSFLPETFQQSLIHFDEILVILLDRIDIPKIFEDRLYRFQHLDLHRS